MCGVCVLVNQVYTKNWSKYNDKWNYDEHNTTHYTTIKRADGVTVADIECIVVLCIVVGYMRVFIQIMLHHIHT